MDNQLRRILVDRFEIIPVLTLYPPWSLFIYKGWKTIETRLHNRYSKALEGLPLAIHSGMRYDKNWEGDAGEFLTKRQIEITKALQKGTKNFKTMGGQIICLTHVYDARKLTSWNSVDALIDCANTERHGLFLRDVKQIKPVKVKGKMGIWYVHPQLLKNVEGLEEYMHWRN